MTFVFLTGWHNSNGSYSFDGKKLNAKKNVNLNFIFASTANVKPLTANRGLRLGVNKINVNLKVSNIPVYVPELIQKYFFRVMFVGSIFDCSARTLCYTSFDNTVNEGVVADMYW